MFWTFLIAFIALMVGWATPQPKWAATLTSKVTGLFGGKEPEEKPEEKSEF